MELWIRSQNKEILMKTQEFRYNQKDKDHSILACDTGGLYRILGIYSSKDRALEVLNEIQVFLILGNDDFNERGLCESYHNIIASKNTIIYEMPEEKEE